MEKNGGGEGIALTWRSERGRWMIDPTAQPEGKGAIDGDEGSVE
jgi:hypothetical protein